MPELPALPALPAGTVTFLYTDLEGSTRQWEQQPAAMRAAVDRHFALLRGPIQAHAGHVFRTTGDGLCAAFATAPAALAAAAEAQRALQREPWGKVGPLRVRLALHTGAVEVQDGDYVGASLNRLGRLLAATHGGQVVLSQATRDLVQDALPAGVHLRDLGEHRLRDLTRAERVFQILHPDLLADFPPLRSLDARPHNLPLQLTSFVGRERELAEVARLLSASRLVTLTGPGGVGKTRLALQAAAEVSVGFSDGVAFVPLAPVTEPDLVVAAIARPLGVRGVPGRPLLDDVVEHLSRKQLLLVLDNCEHVLSAAPVITAILGACPDVKVLATSRAVLRLSGEHPLSVPPLALPEVNHFPAHEEAAGSEAVRLFVERAQASRSDFSLTPQNAPAVAAICQRLDGLPLAIELAAAQVRILSPPALLARLDRALPLLEGGPRDAPHRQRTMRSTLAWSYCLLTPEEEALFRRLAVFVGGCTLDAAAAVCADFEVMPPSPPPVARQGYSKIDVLALLGSLVDQSLLLQIGEENGEPRLVLLEVVREYALEQLVDSGEAEAARRSHAAFFLVFAEQAGAHLVGPTLQNWLMRLETNEGNLRAALDWFVEHGPVEHALRLATALARYWVVHNRPAIGYRWLERVLNQPTGMSEVRPHIRAAALIAAGYLARLSVGPERAARLIEEGLALAQQAGNRGLTADALNRLGATARMRGDYEAAATLHERALALYREAGNERLVTDAANRLAEAMLLQGDHRSAAAILEGNLARQRRLGDVHDISIALNHAGRAALAAGDLDRAQEVNEEGLKLSLSIGDRWGAAIKLHSLARVACARGDDGLAAAHCYRSLALEREQPLMTTTASCLETLAEIAERGGEDERAARLFGAASIIRAKGGGAQPSYAAESSRRAAAAARERLGPAAFDALMDAGQMLSVQAAIAYALREDQPPLTAHPSMPSISPAPQPSELPAGCHQGWPLDANDCCPGSPARLPAGVSPRLRR